ncbi:MAG TPA: hypothetical protein VMG12_38770, partial [Polyangiaceae bacterium]|nr:hypothetical protein [Polyangiaceae bacterium]
MGLALVAIAPRARALELEFEPSVACPADAVRFRVEQALARPLASVEGPAFRVGIEQTNGGYMGRVALPRASDGAGASS